MSDKKVQLEVNVKPAEKMSVDFLGGVEIVTLKGKDGKTPTNEEVIELIKPLIPEPIKGEDGKTPTTDELLSIIEPLIPDPIPGEKGKDGQDAIVDEDAIVVKVLTKIPKSKTVKFNPDTGEQILEKIKGKIDYEDIHNVPNIQAIINQAKQVSKTVSLIELDDVNLAGLTQTNGKYNLGSGGGTITSSNTSLTVVGSDAIINLGKANVWTAKQTFRAGAIGAGTAGVYLQSGPLMTTPEVGAIEFLTDKLYGTITTGGARKEFTLNDIALTSGRVPFATTNGRLTDSSAMTFSGSTLSLGVSGSAAGVLTFFQSTGIQTTSITPSSSGSSINFILPNSGGTPGYPMVTNGTGVLSFAVLGVAGGGTGSSVQLTQGSIVFAGALGVYTQDNPNLTWDSTNKKLTVGFDSSNYLSTTVGATGVISLDAVGSGAKFSFLDDIDLNNNTLIGAYRKNTIIDNKATNSGTTLTGTVYFATSGDVTTGTVTGIATLFTTELKVGDKVNNLTSASSGIFGVQIGDFYIKQIVSNTSFILNRTGGSQSTGSGSAFSSKRYRAINSVADTSGVLNFAITDGMFYGAGSNNFAIANMAPNAFIWSGNATFVTGTNAGNVGFYQWASTGGWYCAHSDNATPSFYCAYDIPNGSVKGVFSAGNDNLYVTAAGLIGNGTIVPTANLDLKASTTANASLRLRSGVSPTTPNDGDVWNDSTQKALVTFEDGIKQVLAGTIFTQTADKTVTNTVTETSIVGTGVGTLTLPTNFWVAGKTIRVTMSGVYSTVTVTGDIVTIKVKAGATVLATKATTALVTGGTNLAWVSNVIVTCRTTGVSGTVQVSGGVTYQTAAAATVFNEINNGVATSTLDTTLSGLLDVTVTHSAASTSNTVKTLVSTFELLN